MIPRSTHQIIYGKTNIGSPLDRELPMFSVAYVYTNHTEASAAVAAERADPISANSFLNAVTLLSFLKITAFIPSATAVTAFFAVKIGISGSSRLKHSARPNCNAPPPISVIPVSRRSAAASGCKAFTASLTKRMSAVCPLCAVRRKRKRKQSWQR